MYNLSVLQDNNSGKNSRSPNPISRLLEIRISPSNPSTGRLICIGFTLMLLLINALFDADEFRELTGNPFFMPATVSIVFLDTV